MITSGAINGTAMGFAAKSKTGDILNIMRHSTLIGLVTGAALEASTSAGLACVRCNVLRDCEGIARCRRCEMNLRAQVCGQANMRAITLR